MNTFNTMDTTTTTTSILKIERDADIRRISVSLGETNFDGLRNIVISLFGLTETEFQQSLLKYKDDEGDEVSICSDLEWKEALRFVGQNQVLRLKLVPLGLPREDFPFPAFVPEAVVHCAQCTKQIERKRFKCEQCPDYVLCKKCYKRNEFEHPKEHTFAKVKRNGMPHPHHHHKKAQKYHHHMMMRGFAPELEGPVVPPVVCHHCNNQIPGKRFKCNDCPDYDLCRKCYKENEFTHPKDHTFTKIKIGKKHLHHHKKWLAKRGRFPHHPGFTRGSPMMPGRGGFGFGQHSHHQGFGHPHQQGFGFGHPHQPGFVNPPPPAEDSTVPPQTPPPFWGHRGGFHRGFHM